LDALAGGVNNVTATANPYDNKATQVGVPYSEILAILEAGEGKAPFVGFAPCAAADK
jgi:hypothetical protein